MTFRGSTGVLDYLSKRHDRSQRMKNLLHQFALMKKLKEERAEGEREWEFKEKNQQEG